MKVNILIKPNSTKRLLVELQPDGSLVVYVRKLRAQKACPVEVLMVKIAGIILAEPSLMIRLSYDIIKAIECPQAKKINNPRAAGNHRSSCDYRANC